MNTQNNAGLQTNQSVKYLEGHPRQYRFDAKEGVFNINGTDKLGHSLTFQPIAWRIFTDNILSLGTKHWAELFFIDPQQCVSAILFHGYSVDTLFRLIEPLYYDDLTLADVVLTAVAERRENTRVQPNGTYYVANFGVAPADPARTAALRQYADTHRIFRRETLTESANVRTAVHYHNPLLQPADDRQLLTS
jgi:hypothetical protein